MFTRLLVLLCLSGVGWAGDYCPSYNTAIVGVDIIIPNSNGHLSGAHQIAGVPETFCTYGHQLVAGAGCPVSEQVTWTVAPAEWGSINTGPNTYHKITLGTVNGYAQASSGGTSATAHAGYEATICDKLVGCGVTSIRVWPIFSYTPNPTLYASGARPYTGYCAGHVNVPKGTCNGNRSDCKTPWIADLSGRGPWKGDSPTSGNNVWHFDAWRLMNFTSKPAFYRWIEPSAHMGVLTRPRRDGTYHMDRKEDVLDHKSLAYYCDDPINSGNGDGYCDEKDWHFRNNDIRWWIPSGKLLTMSETNIFNFMLKAEPGQQSDEHGVTEAWRITVNFGRPDAFMMSDFLLPKRK